MLACLGESRAEVLVEQRLLAVGQSQRPLMTRDGALEMPKFRERVAEIGPDSSARGVASDGVAIAPQGIKVTVHRCEHHAARVAQVGVFRIARDRFP
jgi:hypothetical protein